MGKHYVPQKHLRRFEIDGKPGFIWMYDKKTKKWSEAAISKVAQEADFYSPDVEKALAHEVETPGNNCIDKLLGRMSLNDTERSQLALYMMIMSTRGPGPRRKLVAIASQALQEVIKEARTQIEEWMRADGVNVELAKARLVELMEVEEKFAAQLPSNVIEIVHKPFWSEDTVKCIVKMGWHIVPAPVGSYFVTCDNPAHFFEAYGLGTEQSEFTFPISKEFALVGENLRPGRVLYEKAQIQLVKEINCRIISGADRFIFAHRNHTWIETVLGKSALNPNQYSCH